MERIMIASIIVAGGKGTRMTGKIKKQYLNLGGQPILCHTLSTFDACPAIDEIFLVIPEEDFSYCKQQVLSLVALKKRVHLVPGGNARQASVYNGLMAIERYVQPSPGIDLVVIHDGVRPFVTPEEIHSCIKTAESSGSCILGIPVFDTMKHVDTQSRVVRTIERETIWLAQTPQVFPYQLILKAHNEAREKGFRGTDDAFLVERIGEKVKILQGSRYNIKITTQEDLCISEAILKGGKHIGRG